ncbi:hypothetical protein MKW92_021269 [Papaver armeniacum]|nr:hypothetical protein MKW92_021269 [Papaver armeniacum]
MEGYETSDRDIFIPASKLGEFQRPLHCYSGRYPPLLLKGLERIDLFHFPEVCREHQDRYIQAGLAHQSNILRKRRLLSVHSSKADSSDKKPRMLLAKRERRQRVPKYGSDPALVPLKLQLEEKHRVISLTDVTILPKVGGQGGETIVGTLEAHVNGFLFSSSSFSLIFYFKNIKTSLFRLGDERMPPLVHFHLHDPIVVGTEKTKDIQFHLVQCPPGQKKSDHGKEKEIRDGGHNKDLKNFVDKVNDRWNSMCESPDLFHEIEKDYEFYGVLPSKASAGFALTRFSLIVLVETPFVVVPLRDIEIVNLALLRPGEIDMTVIFQDFEQDNVLEINSIPLSSLAGLKHRFRFVKYYVNAKKLDWKAIVKDIADFPEKFIENGGWDYFKLEDSDTFAYYREIEFGTVSGEQI